MMMRLDILQIEKTINDSQPMEEKTRREGEGKLAHEEKQMTRLSFI